MKNILSVIGAFLALSKVSKMLTEPLSNVPLDWRLVRWLIVATVATTFGMFFVYALHFMATYWPF